MNNALYILDCTEIPNVSVSSVYSISNQINKPSGLLLFDNSIHKDIYNNYFIANNISQNISCIDTDHHNISIYNMMHKYLATHEWFVFLSPYVLYSKDLNTEILNLCQNRNNNEIIILPQNTKNKKAYSIIYHRSIIQKFIKENLSYYHLTLEIEKLLDKNDNNLITIFNGVCWYDIEKAYSLPTNIYYKDKNCMIANFLGIDTISDSLVYINNRNYRCYNIANNFIGQITNTNNTNITILWQLNESGNTKGVQYTLDHLNKYYIPT